MTRRIFAGAVLAALALTGCADEGAGPDPSSSREEAWNSAYQGLCQSKAAADDGEVADANGIFMSESHGPLHDLASAGSDGHRATVARLLEAKAEVEELFALTSLDAAEALGELQHRTAELIAAVTESPQPECSGEEGSE